MDRASASEAGNVGSTPAERKFNSPALCGAIKFMLGAGQLLGPRRESKAGALCEFEFAQCADERRAWRGGAASGEGQRADLWPTTAVGAIKFMLGAGQLLGPRRESWVGKMFCLLYCV